jgi:CheY-like chemotaxis protein
MKLKEKKAAKAIDKTKILVVEDYFTASMGLCNLLDFWGYDTCKLAKSGEEAVKKAEQERPDVVVMDMDLSGTMNGIEAAKTIRSSYGIPIIFTTAFSDDQTIEIAKAAEPVGYFVKPLDFYKLRSFIDIAVNKN